MSPKAGVRQARSTLLFSVVSHGEQDLSAPQARCWPRPMAGFFRGLFCFQDHLRLENPSILHWLAGLFCRSFVRYTAGLGCRSILPTGRWSCLPFKRSNPTNTPTYEASVTMAKSGKRKKKVETLFLVCDETGDYNYTVRRKPGGEKLKLKKFCPRLQRHTLHTEKKK